MPGEVKRSPRCATDVAQRRARSAAFQPRAQHAEGHSTTERYPCGCVERKMGDVSKKRPRNGSTEKQQLPPSGSHLELDRSVVERLGAVVIGVMNRLSGFSKDLPKTREEWDVYVRVHRSSKGGQAEVFQASAQRLAGVLARAHFPTAVHSMRRRSQRRDGGPSTAEAGMTESSTNSERTKSRRSSKVA
jgi:hypothetical protein